MIMSPGRSFLFWLRNFSALLSSFVTKTWYHLGFSRNEDGTSLRMFSKSPGFVVCLEEPGSSLQTMAPSATKSGEVELNRRGSVIIYFPQRCRACISERPLSRGHGYFECRGARISGYSRKRFRGGMGRQPRENFSLPYASSLVGRKQFRGTP